MATYFVMSDIHGYYNEMQTALNNAGFDINNKNHVFVSCGDLLDRGPDAIKCLEFVNGLPKDRKILIMGNHEDLMIEATLRGYFGNHDYHNRTNDTVYQVTNMSQDLGYDESDALKSMKENPLWNTYLNSCVDYYETPTHIFVHGWIPTGLTISKDEKWANLPEYYRPVEDGFTECWRDGDWMSARWSNGMSMWQKGIKVEGKTIVCGHWHTSWGHSRLHHVGTEWNDDFARVGVEMGLLSADALTAHFEPFKDDGILAIDSCCAYSGKLNCVKLGKMPKVIVNETDD